jgi:Protein of unknown function (DUF433)
VLEYLASGMTEDQFLADFRDLEREDIRAVLLFAAERERRLSSITVGHDAAASRAPEAPGEFESRPARLPDVTRRHCVDSWHYRVAKATPCAAVAISAATAFGWDTYIDRVTARDLRDR